MKLPGLLERVPSLVRRFLLTAITLLIPAASLFAAVNPEQPKIPRRIFSIANYGATGDGVATNTNAIQAAIEAANAAGGGMVDVPAGIYLCGPLRIASRINLHLAEGAVLRMLPLDTYPGGTSHPENFIGGSDLHDVAITGTGTIDGQGAPWWPFAKTKGANRPRMIALSACERVLIESVTLKNSPMFHIAIGGGSSDVIVRGVTIRAPSSTDKVQPSHNSDACDVSGHNILIQDCDVSVGDDNFTCGGGTSDVLIMNCTYGNGHGVSIGSGTKGGVSNFTVRHCTFTNTDCGIRIKTDRDRGGHVENITYEDLQMTNVGFPILVYASYMAKEPAYRDLTNLSPAIASSYPAAPVGKTTPRFSNITFRNITATAALGKRAGLVWGLPEMNAADILLENVKITADKPFGIFNARGVRLINCQITTPEGLNKIVSDQAQISLTP